MSHNLWIAQATPSKTFGPTRISIDGCECVDDFLKEIKKEFAISVPTTHLTLYQTDRTTEINVGDSPANYLDENTNEIPLFFRIVEVAETSPSKKAAWVLRSNLTAEEKESILKDIWGVDAKEREVQDKVSLYEALKEKTQRIEAERDFIKGTLDARHIFAISNSKPKSPKANKSGTMEEAFGFEHKHFKDA